MKDEATVPFLYIPLTTAEEAEVLALSDEDRRKRRLAWLQAQNVIWLLSNGLPN